MGGKYSRRRKKVPRQKERPDEMGWDSREEVVDNDLHMSSFRAEKRPRGTRRTELHETLLTSLAIRRAQLLQDAEGLDKLVTLPASENEFDWIAVNLVNFYNIASLVYGTLLEHCSEVSCPAMMAGPKYKFNWHSGDGYIEVSARRYITLMFDYIENIISDSSIFPETDEDPYPDNFRKIAHEIVKRLFRMYAHVYYGHFDVVSATGEHAQAHLNSSFQHFIYFAIQNKLIDDEELTPLRNLVSKLTPGTNQ